MSCFLKLEGSERILYRIKAHQKVFTHHQYTYRKVVFMRVLVYGAFLRNYRHRRVILFLLLFSFIEPYIFDRMDFSSLSLSLLQNAYHY